MSPDRTLSRIAKMIDKLAEKLERDKAFPSTENLKQFNNLVAEYSKLLSTINAKTAKGDQGEQDLEDILIRGRKGAYERLLEE
ncbi:hypothetical protein PITCH_A210003 [uncultured Desulfobacterium sp.]|uniref:Uncharacterized protein n=1 Tax=uncultured Desulfobacterium sp. TaxID=201089 RepID=A0A445MXI0_9BACT|nr:hypothetical protein PITCH_A210003 [uncultured Desulfobacterium sp.]